MYTAFYISLKQDLTWIKYYPMEKDSWLPAGRQVVNVCILIFVQKLEEGRTATKADFANWKKLKPLIIKGFNFY